jgi:hypothetical protein
VIVRALVGDSTIMSDLAMNTPSLKGR